MLIELVEEFDPNLLLKFKLSESCFSKFLHSMGWVDRAITKASHKLPDGHVQLTEKSAMRLAWVVFTYHVRKDMVINLDETGVILVPARSRRLAPQGVKNVACVGNRDRRQVTSTPAANVLGEKLMLQVIFQGKSVRSPSANRASFPRGQAVWSASHWCTEQTFKDLFRLIIPPFFQECRLGEEYAIVILDLYSVHREESFREWVKAR